MEIDQVSLTDILTPRRLSLLGVIGAGVLLAVHQGVEATDKKPLNTQAETVWQACDNDELTSYVLDDDRYEICAVLPESNNTEDLSQLVNRLAADKPISEATIYITDPTLNELAAVERSDHRSPSDEIEAATEIQSITGLTVRQQWTAGEIHNQPITRLTLKDW